MHAASTHESGGFRPGETGLQGPASQGRQLIVLLGIKKYLKVFLRS